MDWRDLFNTALSSGTGLVNSRTTAQAAEDARKAEEAKARAAVAGSSWTKYIPLGIGALVLLGVIGFFATRKG